MGPQRGPSTPAASRGAVSGECSSPLPRVMRIVRQSPAEKPEEEDDFRVPIYDQRGVGRSSSKDRHLADGETKAWPHSSSSQRNGATAFKSSHRAQNGSSGRPGSTESPRQKLGKGNNGGTGEDEISGETKSIESAPLPAARGNHSDPSGPSGQSSNPDHQGGKLSETGPLRGRSSARVPSGDAELGSGDAERSGSSGSPEKMLRDAARDGSPRHAGRAGDASETSMADSAAGASISPDSVVGVIGPKHFWKARRAIIKYVWSLFIFRFT